MRTIGWLAAVGSLVASFAFMVVSLNRWEWNRALFFGLIFLIAEIALATALVLRRLSLIAMTVQREPAALDALRETRPNRERFAWLKSSSQELNVFITFLVGGGAIVSAVAWCIDRVATRTSTPLAEARLAQRLASIAYPRGGLLVEGVEALVSDGSVDRNEHLTALLRHVPHGR